MSDSPVKFTDLFPDLVIDIDAWNDFLNVADDVFSARIDSPIQQLEEIRDLKPLDVADGGTDIEIKDRTIRLLGFDISHDFMSLNREQTAKLAYLFSHYYEQSSTDNWVKFFAFLLGRNVDVLNLYTQDYSSFYEIPLGDLNVDGGTFYKTTHVNVSIDLKGLEGKVIRRPDQALQDRVMELFYEYAPINLVVHQFFFGIPMNFKIFLDAQIYHDTDTEQFTTIGLVGPLSGVEPESIEIHGPDEVLVGSKVKYSLLADWGSDVQSYVSALRWESSNALIRIGHSGTARIATVVGSANTCTLTATYGSKTATKTVTILKTAANEVLNIAIASADTLPEATEYTFKAHIIWSASEPVLISTDSHLTWKSSSPLIKFADKTSGYAFVESVAADTDVLITVEYKQGAIKKTASKTVRILNTKSEARLADITITGPSTVEENDSAVYVAKAIFTDGRPPEPIFPKWRFLSTVGTIYNNGALRIGFVSGDLDAYLEAEYRIGKTVKTARKLIHIRDNRLDITEVHLVGPDEVLERAEAQYQVVVKWSNNKTNVIQPDHWYATYYKINKTGLFKAGLVKGMKRNVTISADFAFTRPGADTATVLTCSKNIVVAKEKIVITYISIHGPSDIKRGATKQYEVFAKWSNGAVTRIDEPVWSLDVDFAVISEDGLLSILGTPDQDYLTLTASYADSISGKTLTDSHVISLVHEIVFVSELEIQGADSLLEYTRETYTAIVRYEDGSEAIVTPKWTIRNLDVNLKDPVATVNSAGDVLASPVDFDTAAVLTAKFYDKEVSKTISIKNVKPVSADIVADAWIEGPDLVDFRDEFADYTLWVLWEGAPTPTPLSPDWSTTASSKIADIDSNGTLFMRKNVDLDDVEISATYACGYAEPLRVSKKIGLRKTRSDSFVKITGPDSVNDNSTTAYKAWFVDVEGAETEITTNSAAIWSLNTSVPAITLSNHGALTAPKILANVSVTLKLKYTVDGRVYNASRAVQIKSSYIVGSLALTGDATISDLGTHDFYAMFTRSAIDTNVSLLATWSIESSLPGVTVANGKVTIPYFDVAHTAYLTAVYNDGYRDYTQSLNITLQPVAKDLLVAGTTTLTVGGNYDYTATFKNGALSTNVTSSATWTATSTLAGVTIANGRLVVPTFDTNRTVTVTASYHDGFKTYTKSLTVNLQPIPDTSTLTIAGPTLVEDPGSYDYTVTYFNSANSTSTPVTTQALWSVVASPNDMTPTIALGSLDVPEFTANHTLTITATYVDGTKGKSYSDTHSVQIRPRTLGNIALYGKGPIGAKTASAALAVLTGRIDNLILGSSQMSITLGTNEYGYFAVPVAKGEVNFFDTSINLAGGWDGASWPDDGSYGEGRGPITLTMTYAGVTAQWYLYRTDEQGLGPKTFRIDP
jgi:hypothetical protein